LYESGEEDIWVPKERRIIAIPNPSMKPVRIDAPWEGTQEGSDKAILVAELDSQGKLTEDRYIIGNLDLLLKNYGAEDM
jgi:hypothetical protein